MESKSAGQDDLALYGSEIACEGLVPFPGGLGQTAPERASAAVVGTYRTPEGWERWSLPMILLADAPDSYLLEGRTFTVGEILPQVKLEIYSNPQYDLLIDSMETFRQQAPIRLFDTVPYKIRDGLHRIAIAVILDWPWMYVTRESTAVSTWQVWDESSTGKKYHQLWRERIGL